MFTPSWASLIAQLVKNLPAIRDTWVHSLGWEDPLEKGKATTPVFWPGEFHGLYSPWGHKESDTTEQLWFHFTPSQSHSPKIKCLLKFPILGCSFAWPSLTPVLPHHGHTINVSCVNYRLIKSKEIWVLLFQILAQRSLTLRGTYAAFLCFRLSLFFHQMKEFGPGDL